MIERVPMYTHTSNFPDPQPAQRRQSGGVHAHSPAHVPPSHPTPLPDLCPKAELVPCLSVRFAEPDLCRSAAAP